MGRVATITTAFTVKYSPMLLMLELLPESRFAGRKAAWAFRVFVLLVLVWCALAIIVPGPYDNVWEGDDRFEGASTPDQIADLTTQEIAALVTEALEAELKN